MNLTASVLFSATLLLLAFEAWTVLNAKPNDTESEELRRGMIAFPVMTLFGGVLCGHWFIPRCGAPDPLILGVMTFAAVALVLGQFISYQNVLARRLAAGFVFGLTAGYLFWPLCVDATRGASVSTGVCLS